MKNCPVYIVCRDRLHDLRNLVGWLEDAGHQRIVLLDNASTYPPLLEYLGSTPHEVVRLTHNWGSRVFWIADEWRPPGNEWFVYTDPDVLPIEGCPADLVEHLHALLLRFPQIPKAGPGLYLDDLPESMPSLEWERSLIGDSRRLSPNVYDSLIDTTFALYRPNAQFHMHAIRTTGPYQVRHMPWYRQSKADLAADDCWYLEHVNPDLEPEGQGTTWRPS